ncbi:MAG: methylmalonyl Co-A mutase-associated GTPase MeaB, partial [Rhodospirillaceae bacterium]|nr:methylmalonyl Co-A mutase-associated GTPase MeaB [Rhodospirillaceae bacterium]
SALEGKGLGEIWATVQRFQAEQRAGGRDGQDRAVQAQRWLWEEIQDDLLDELKSDKALAPLITARERAVGAGEITPSAAAREILRAFLGKEKSEE